MGLKIVVRECDGMGWFEDGDIVINVRWSCEETVVEDIVSTYIHEFVEHVLGLGHEAAERAERLVVGLLKEAGAL